jgi:GntR family transcriptional regulator/MocR family aminotransferase
MTTLHFPLERTADAPLHRQIYEGVRSRILAGVLKPGQRLPSTRALAQDLAVSRQPVLAAYEQLLHEGYLEGRSGAGTYVCRALPDDLLASVSRMPSPRGERRRRPKHFATDVGRLMPFRIGIPALEHFPHALWARLVARHARHSTPADMVYGDPAGLPALRAAVAAHLRAARGVDCEPDQVLVVSGSQAALRLVAAVLLERGARVAIEEPGYFGARMAFDAHGAVLAHVPVDREGLRVDALRELAGGARAVYVTPSHQYPLGTTMSAARRLALLDWAREHDAWVLEDDYDSAFRYASRPLGALQGMREAARVIYIGTFSKTLFPALRVGYVVVPPELVPAFAEARVAFDVFSPTLYQKVLAEFLEEGHFERHLRRMRTVYEARRDALLDGLARFTGGRLEPVNADAGLQLAALLTAGEADRPLVRRLKEKNVTAVRLSACYYGGGPPQYGLLLGFSGSAEPELLAATRVLGEVLRASP